jgi:hypothetical protein
VRGLSRRTPSVIDEEFNTADVAAHVRAQRQSRAHAVVNLADALE